jgi:hypothetical protein
LDWSPLNRWTELAQSLIVTHNKERLELLEYWNGLLAEFGGDPSTKDWLNFRPLRLSREEDWTDWLATLLESSKTGHLARLLFSESFDDRINWADCTAYREESTPDGHRRGDLILKWQNHVYAHVEVKVGDTHFDKTFETGHKLKNKFKTAQKWRNFILLPMKDVENWIKTRERIMAEDELSGQDDVEQISWNDVAVGLRQSLAHGKEDTLWRSWAYAFEGNIGQRLLEHPLTLQHHKGSSTLLISELDKLATQTEIFRKGLEYVI